MRIDYTSFPGGKFIVVVSELTPEQKTTLGARDWARFCQATGAAHVFLTEDVVHFGEAEEQHELSPGCCDTTPQQAPYDLVPNYHEDTRLTDLVARVLHLDRRKNGGPFRPTTPWDELTPALQEGWRKHAHESLQKEVERARTTEAS